MKTGISDLREHLFATIEDLRNEEKPMDIARAKAIAEVAQTIIASARVEVDFIEATGGTGSGFIPLEQKAPAPAPAGAPRLVKSS